MSKNFTEIWRSTSSRNVIKKCKIYLKTYYIIYEISHKKSICSTVVSMAAFQAVDPDSNSGKCIFIHSKECINDITINKIQYINNKNVIF